MYNIAILRVRGCACVRAFGPVEQGGMSNWKGKRKCCIALPIKLEMISSY
jgi:hypothetical protein